MTSTSQDPNARSANAETGRLAPQGRRAPLRVGVDATCLGSGRGYGRFLRELLPPLIAQAGERELVLFLDEATAAEVELPALPRVLVRTSESQARGASARGSRSLADALRMGRAVSSARLDAFYFPSIFSFFPVPGRTPLAVAIHDTIPERHGQIVFPTLRTRWLWNLKSRLARWQARHIVTVSDYARRCLADQFGIPEPEIFVTPEAPSPAFHPPAEAAPREAWLRGRGIPDAPYFIYVGGFNPHKNVIGLTRSFARLRLEGGHPLPHLILVGDHEGDTFHDNVSAIRCEVEMAGIADRVHWAGFVPDEELRHLYAGAQALVLPSLEEGFGLPAVEAAACGAPCVATRESPLPEVLEGGGIFFDPRRPDALQAALRTMLLKPADRDALAGEALRRAGALSWEETARETWRALEATAGRQP